MITWLFFIVLFYFIYKTLIPLIGLFRFSQSVKKERDHNNIHKKISKMDIQDAEFDDINS